MKRTKIGATLGPATQDIVVIEKMVKAGVNFVRLNFSHGTYPDHARIIKNVRLVEKITGEPLAVLQDLQGPKMRLGILPEPGVKVKLGEKIVFNTKLKSFSGKVFPITYPGLEKFLKSGEHMLIDDGRVEVKITVVKGAIITAHVIQGGLLSSHKGFNFPQSNLSSIPALSLKDKADVAFGVKQGVDIISLSFVKHAQDILELKKLIAQEQKKQNPHPIMVLAKIERPEAVKNLKAIIIAADAIMVARGDLGLELPEEKLALLQKKIIHECNRAGKPVIVATQLLDSMQHNLRPTRAEATDVANAVIDHTDALLLTNETAVGDHPVECVKTLHDIIVATEKSAYDDVPLPTPRKGATNSAAIAGLSRFLAEEVQAKAIVASADNGATIRLISQARPELPILAASPFPTLSRHLNISWGVKPFNHSTINSTQELVQAVSVYLKKNKLAKAGDKMIVVGSEGKKIDVNAVEVREIL
ncbi:MAG: pyruvate kinase [Candidatus Magasanikbacteria bacterium]|nr:pyruvate kinase [Candidatus Magasanikbacteria bacterium]